MQLGCRVESAAFLPAGLGYEYVSGETKKAAFHSRAALS